MHLGFDLKLEQTQKLNLTQEMVQAIKILQLNTSELEVYVNDLALSNPVLEKDFLIRDNPSYSSGFRKEKPQGTPFKKFNVNAETLSEHLLLQLGFLKIPKHLNEICEFVVDNLDGNGYLRLTPAQLAEDLDISEAQMLEAIRIVQSLEPKGVGASCISECLLLQMKANGSWTETKEIIISEHLEELALNRLGSIARTLKISIEDVQAVADEIRSLDPKPGRAFASEEETRYITPDVYLEEENGEYKVVLNERTRPEVSINPYYLELLANSKDNPQLHEYLQAKIKAAKWLVDSLEQRGNTIYNVASAIVEYQREFFEKGEKYMKPLILKQIAEVVDVHESTVSRTINGKYIQTPKGVFELKHFFNSGVSSKDGSSGVSSKAIKKMIQELVDEEDPRKPISDQKIADAFARKGIDIARRTVAKYREELGIYSSQKRKRY